MNNSSASHGQRHVLTRQFLCAGYSTFTVQIPAEFAAKNGTPNHYTFRLEKPSEDKPIFAMLLCGPDNESDYKYIGLVDASSGNVRVTKKSAFGGQSWPVVILTRVLIRLFADQQEKIEKSGWSVMHVGKCGRCGRTLSTPASIQSGIGPECLRIMKCGE